MRRDDQEDRHGRVNVRNETVINHYHAPVSVNQIGQAYNPNFGANYGYLNQSISQTSPSKEWASSPRPVVRPILEAGIFSLLNPILDASHTRNMKRSPPDSQCLPGTRKEVIRDIKIWADADVLDTHPHILWVFGYAGCGKSAIAHAIAKDYAQKRRLAACFVFFRGSGDRSTAERFATTVASQVASAFPETEAIIESILRRNPGLLHNTTSSLSDQFEHLVCNPIHAIASQLPTPVLIVLDGVDECRDSDDMSALIENIIKFFERHPDAPVRFLITSRVEDHLHQVLHTSNQVQLLNLVERTSDSDIAAALDVVICNAKRGRLLVCDESWPSLWDRRSLVKHIGGSFLFMTLIVQKLFDRNSKDGLTPMERLPLILAMKADFDDLYTEILSPWQGLPHFHAVISTIALALKPLSIVQLADILSIKTVNVVNVLIHLHSIMQVPGDDRTPVTLWHTSLRDYLCDQSRACSFYARPRYHLQLAYWGSNASCPLQRTASQYVRRFALDYLRRFLAGSDNLERDKATVKLNGLIFKEGQTAIEVACLARGWSVVRALVNTGINVNVPFRKPEDGIVCALHAACYHKEWELIHLLLEKGADPNIISPNEGSGFRDGTALAFAARISDAKLATMLLDCGANPNLQGGVCGTALRSACIQDSVDIVNLLLNHGADPNLQCGFYNTTALHRCAGLGHYSCAHALLEFGADLNIQDKLGDTPLHDACRGGKVEMVEWLLQVKADANIKNRKGETPLQVAQEQKDEEIIRVLLQNQVEE